MSFYKKATQLGLRYFAPGTLFKYGFNLSPMYRRSTGKVIKASNDLLTIQIKIPISWRNRNYMNTIFGGSLFAAVDPIPMIQLFNLLDDSYIVWDKSAEIFFKRPAREDVYALFTFTAGEVADIKKRVTEEKEVEVVKKTKLTNLAGDITFCEVNKRLYIADKNYFKEKQKRRKASSQ